jgi:hypothetical protein
MEVQLDQEYLTKEMQKGSVKILVREIHTAVCIPPSREEE